MKNKFFVLILAVVVLGLGGGAFYVMKNGNGAGSAAGGGNGAGGATSSVTSDQMKEWRTAHKNTFQLTSLVRNIGRLDTESSAPLSADQAKQILAVLEPLRKQTALTQDDARDTSISLNKILTEQQRDAISQMKAPPRRSGQGGPGGGRPGGMGKGFDPAVMQDFNPFNPPAGTPMATQGTKRWTKFFTKLHEKAGDAPKSAEPAGDAGAGEAPPAGGHHHHGQAGGPPSTE